MEFAVCLFPFPLLWTSSSTWPYHLVLDRLLRLFHLNFSSNVLGTLICISGNLRATYVW
jgi:hypothetical protein